MNKKILGILVVTLLIGTALPAFGSIGSFQTIDGEQIASINNTDWWSMFRHDSSNTGFTASNGRDNNNIRWEITTLWSTSSPSVYDGKVYIAENSIFSFHNNLYCLNADNGKVIWDVDMGHSVHSSPAFYDGKIYIGSYSGYVCCFNANNGNEIWRHDIGSDYVYSSPTVVDEKVYIGNNRNIFCLDAMGNGDGTTDLIWSREIAGGVTSSIAVENGNIYFGTGHGYVFCLNANTGNETWNFPTQWTEVVSSPAIAYGRVYIGGKDYHLYCFDMNSGSIIWKYEFAKPHITSSPAVADNKVYVVSGDGNIYCINAHNKALIWKYEVGPPEPGSSSPAIANGMVYVGGRSRFYCFGDDLIEPDPLPDLECHGSLSWSSVTPGDTVTGNFTVENIGYNNSLLNWSVVEFPDWGNWACEPSEGYELKPDDGEITVEVVVSAPEQQGMKFVGEIKIVNTDNSSDYDIIQVALSTPKDKSININPFFLRFLEQHFHIFPLLQKLLGL